MSKGIPPADRSAWEQRGGRIRFDGKGRPVYLIRKQVRGERFEVSTRKHTLAAALAEWEKFEKDPVAYARKRDRAAPLYLENELLEKFLAWSLNEKGNTKAWVVAQKSGLAWWLERLGGIDLRRVTVADHLDPALKGAPGRRHRIEVIKAFYGWLVKVEHSIDPHEDPTFRVLTVPQASPAQWAKSKVVPLEHYLLVRDLLTSPWREALIVLAGTGWHVSELCRFVEAGAIEPLPKALKAENGAAGVLLCPRHKSGDVHRSAVSQSVLDAAIRLRTRGHFARDYFEKSVAAACRAVKCPDGTAGIPPFKPAWFRHTNATRAYESGTDLGAVSAYLGHKSVATTRRFYATLATVPKIPTVE